MDPAKVYAEKSIEDLYDWEFGAADLLARSKFSITLLDEDPLAPTNIDTLISGQPWELKNVGDGKHSIKDQLGKARRKWARHALEGPAKAVVSCSGRTKSDESTAKDNIRRSRYWDEVTLISSDGKQ